MSAVRIVQGISDCRITVGGDYLGYNGNLARKCALVRAQIGK